MKKIAPIGGWPNLLSGPENLCFLSFYNIYQPNKLAGPKNSRIPGGGYNVVPKVGIVNPRPSAAIIFGGRGYGVAVVNKSGSAVANKAG